MFIQVLTTLNFCDMWSYGLLACFYMVCVCVAFVCVGEGGGLGGMCVGA